MIKIDKYTIMGCAPGTKFATHDFPVVNSYESYQTVGRILCHEEDHSRTMGKAPGGRFGKFGEEQWTIQKLIIEV